MSSERPCRSCGGPWPIEAFARRNGVIETICKACVREMAQIRKHGVTSLEKEQIADAQGGCATCGGAATTKGWVVDHDRSCCPGDASCESCRRGVLCGRCNAILGYALDNPETLRRAADFLACGTRLITPHRTPYRNPFRIS